MTAKMEKTITALLAKPQASEYSGPIRIVRHVATWVWPHDHVVYPHDRYRPRIDDVDTAKGRKKLLKVLAYLESRAHLDFMSR